MQQNFKPLGCGRVAEERERGRGGPSIPVYGAALYRSPFRLNYCTTIIFSVVCGWLTRTENLCLTLAQKCNYPNRLS